MSEQSNNQDRWAEITNIWKQFSGFYDLMRGSSIVLMLLIIGGYFFAVDVLDDYTTNVFTEALGVITTVLIVDILARHRAEAERKEELIFQLGSEDNSTALAAARILRHKGWLTDGSLKGANLLEANLQGANLVEANLQDAYLVRANLQNADLSFSNLGGVRLWKANLKGANLQRANLKDANLYLVDLQNTNFMMTNLSGANLRDSNLKDAVFHAVNLQGSNLVGTNLQDANLQGDVIVTTKIGSERDMIVHVITLPDGTKWTQGTDLRRFTDQGHPDYEATKKKIKNWMSTL